MRSLTRILFQRPQLWQARPLHLMRQKCRYKFSTNSNYQSGPKFKTLPLQNFIGDATTLDLKVQPTEFCLFSSVQPIFPNNPMNCQIKIGNLKRITKPLLYSIISPDNGQIYTIGIALGKSVEKNLNAELKLLEQKDANGNIFIHNHFLKVRHQKWTFCWNSHYNSFNQFSVWLYCTKQSCNDWRNLIKWLSLQNWWTSIKIDCCQNP